jgi:AcrR family transcriptional regulator
VTEPDDGTGGPRRARGGRPPLISQRDVLRAAEELGVEHVTIRGVAQRLGVSRAAVYRHVSSSDALRSLTAQANVATFVFDDDDIDDWREWLAELARAFRSWRLANAHLSGYVSREVLLEAGAVALADDAVARLVAAGFTEQRALEALQFVAGVVWINTQDQILTMAEPDQVHPQVSELVHADERSAPAAQVTRAIELVGVLGAPFDERFEREVAWAIAALDQELVTEGGTQAGTPAGPPA